MSNVPLEQPLNKHQLEILKLFSRDLDDNDLIEIKKLIVSYLGNKISNMVDNVWDEKGWTNEDMKKMLLSDKRTPYNPSN